MLVCMLHAISYHTPIPEQFSASLIPQNQRSYPDSISGQLTLDEAIAYLEQELNRIGASKASIYTHYNEIKSPQLRKQTRNDSAVLLEFSINNKDYRMIAAHWQLVDHNLYALHMVLRQLSSLVKWHIASLPALLHAFEVGASANAQSASASSEPISGLTHWMKELGLGPTATKGDISAIYHRRARLCENDEELLELNAIVDEARKSVV